MGREDNVLVFCESNGDGFIQCPESSLWIQNMGVDKASSIQISNVSADTVAKDAETLKASLVNIRFELHNDSKMPTITIDKRQNTTECVFYDGLCASFAHPNDGDAANDAVSVV